MKINIILARNIENAYIRAQTMSVFLFMLYSCLYMKFILSERYLKYLIKLRFEIAKIYEIGLSGELFSLES